MRTVTIKREKSFVACLGKMKVYIEDHVSGEITICGVPCRKLGTLKNGEEVSFQIEEQALKIFVIADTLSKEYCNEYYQLDEGSEDVYLSGKNRYNPANGNAFRFDNNNSEGIAENRSRGTKKGITVLIIAAIVGAIIGFSIVFSVIFGSTFIRMLISGEFSDEAEAKTFSAEELCITLTDEFHTFENSGYTAAYDSKDVAVFILKESFKEAAEFKEYTVKEYADLLIKVNQVGSRTRSEGELTYFEYDFKNPEDNKLYHYMAFVYKSDTAFWSVTFAMLSDSVDEYGELVKEWARSVEFAD